MQILVAGATGNTGQRVVKELQSRGHQPVALVRESSDTSVLPDNVQQRQGDLTSLSDDVCDGCVAVIFAAGSGGDTDAEMTDKVDRDGAKKLIDIAAKAKVNRFVMLSSVGADNPQAHDQLQHYLEAKHDADQHLMQSGLDYAVIRPVALTDEDGSREMRFGDDVENDAKAARGDVAAVLARAVDEDQWLGQAVTMQSV